MAEKNNKMKHQAHSPVMTDRICSDCGSGIASNEVSLVRVISFIGAKRSSGWKEFHRKHLPKI